MDYAYQTRRKFPERRIFLAGEIIHNPHVNEQLREHGHRVPHGEGPRLRLRPAAGGRGDPAGVRRHHRRLRGAARTRLRGGGHHLRVGAQRVEARETYARDGFTALIHGKYYHEETRATASQVRATRAASISWCATWTRRKLVCDYIEARRRPRDLPAALRARGAPGLRPGAASAPCGRGQPDDHAGARVAGDRASGGRGHGTTLWCGPPGRALPHLRHDLQRHAGPAGCGARAARRAAGRDGRDRRLQLQQHDVAGRALRRAGADVPHRGRELSGPRDRLGALPAGRQQGGGARRAVAACERPCPRRPDGRCQHAEQQDRRDGGADLRDAGIGEEQV